MTHVDTLNEFLGHLKNLGALKQKLREKNSLLAFKIFVKMVNTYTTPLLGGDNLRLRPYSMLDGDYSICVEGSIASLVGTICA